MKYEDFDLDEREFRHDFEPAIRNAKARAGACPHPDVLMAAASGVVFESSDRVLQHLNVCPTCRQLNQDLMSYENPGVSTAEDRRIRARWAHERTPWTSAVWAWIRQPVPMLAAAAIIFVSIIGIWSRQTIAPEVPVAVVQQPSEPAVEPRDPTPNAFLLVLEKAPVKLAAASVLTFRSDSPAGKGFLDELASALEPYRADRYSEAALRLDALASRYPEAPEPHLYLGVSRLFLQENGPALSSLEAARRLADETLRDDVSWYLALALERLDRGADVRREIEALCLRDGEYKTRACAALEELRRR